MILILGASSRIGGHFFKEFKQEELEVIGTYCNNPAPGMIHFNLETMLFEELDLKTRPSHAIIAAAANPRPELSKNMNNLYRINVTRTKMFIEACFRGGIVPIYLSSDNVFDGKKGNYNEEDVTNPINNYGKMKSEIEDFLFSSNRPYVLLRTGKVFGISKDKTLFLETIEKLRGGEKLLCSEDQVFTPCYAKDLYDFTRQIIERNYTGVFHVGSTLPVTRYQIAQKIRTFFKIENGEIVTCKINEIGLLEKRPLKIDLDLTKYKKLTGKYEKDINVFLENLQANRD